MPRSWIGNSAVEISSAPGPVVQACPLCLDAGLWREANLERDTGLKLGSGSRLLSVESDSEESRLDFGLTERYTASLLSERQAMSQSAINRSQSPSVRGIGINDVVVSCTAAGRRTIPCQRTNGSFSAKSPQKRGEPHAFESDRGHGTRYWRVTGLGPTRSADDPGRNGCTTLTSIEIKATYESLFSTNITSLPSHSSVYRTSTAQ